MVVRSAYSACLVIGSSLLTAAEKGRGLLQCSSDDYLGSIVNASKKGITLDDTTLRYCTARIPDLWPNSVSAIQTLRMFRSWNPSWEEALRQDAWDGLVNYARENGAKLLMAAPITCDKEADDEDWYLTKELMKRLGPEHVMGLAVGNELELLWHNSPMPCVREIWNQGRLWDTFRERVREIDELGFGEVPVTTVFTASVLYEEGFYPFPDIPDRVMAKSFFENATKAYGSRFTFTFNIYPYFDPKLEVDPGTKDQCTEAVAKAACWKGPECLGPVTMVRARERIKALTGENSRFWIGEVGWSAPAAVTLKPDLQACKQFSSLDTLNKFYQGFLAWDMQLPDYPPPDHIFYFTLRNALNYGIQEYFGLMFTCKLNECKLKSEDFKAADALRPPIEPSRLVAGFAVLLGSVVLFTIAVTAWVCLQRRTKDKSARASRYENESPPEESDED